MSFVRCFFSIISMTALFLFSCTSEKKESGTEVVASEAKDTSMRIVSTNGAITEILSGLGLEDKIVGVDVTSNYPESVQKIPKLGHNREIAIEKIMEQKPTILLGLTSNIKPELLEQLNTAGVRGYLFDQDFSVDGTKKLITQIADSLKRPEGAKPMIDKIDKDLSEKTTLENHPKILFIYARGPGALTVMGKNTQAASIIELSGGVNATNDFENSKPLTSEGLVAANPDIILMFDNGIQSLGGLDGLLSIPGVAQTNAGKNKRVIEMEGQYLLGFGPRVGQAVSELSKKIKELSGSK